MAHRQGGHKTSELVFPSNWTGKWLYNAIASTPKWQAESLLNSYKYQTWINILSTNLNGLVLPKKTGNIEQDVFRSIAVGLVVHKASQEYENMPVDVPLPEKVKMLKDMMNYPLVGDMVKARIQLPQPMMPMNKTSVQIEEPEMLPTPTRQEIMVEVPKARRPNKEEELVIAE